LVNVGHVVERPFQGVRAKNFTLGFVAVPVAGMMDAIPLKGRNAVTAPVPPQVLGCEVLGAFALVAAHGGIALFAVSSILPLPPGLPGLPDELEPKPNLSSAVYCTI
jgi:hypothetical protein